MEKITLIKAFITWLIFIPVAMLNGAVRQILLLPRLGDTKSRQVSTIILSSAYILLSYLLIGEHLSRIGNGQLLITGLIWLFLTLAFEFGLGLATGKSWGYMLKDYKITKGRIWPFFLFIVLISPYIIKFLNK